VRVRIIPVFALEGIEAWVRVEPALVIETEPRRMQGLGVQTMSLTVSVRGITLTDSLPVTFDASKGSVEPHQLMIGPDGTGSVRLRSAGIGPVTIGASSPAVPGASVLINYVFPFLFLVAALLGGALGGWAAKYRGERGHSGTGGYIIKGTVYGFLAAVAYFALGVNILRVRVDIQFFNEGAVFAFAALAGFLLVGLFSGRTAPAGGL
jgi:hypothetical protein